VSSPAHWSRSDLGTWHAWPHPVEPHRTFCGLDARPGGERRDFPPQGKICSRCRKSWKAAGLRITPPRDQSDSQAPGPEARPGRPPLLEWMHRVAESDLPPTTRHVLLTLALDGDMDGARIWPGVRRLARRSGLARETVIRHLASAQESGWIDPQSRGQRGDGRWMSHRYALTAPALVTEDHQEEEKPGDSGSPGGQKPGDSLSGPGDPKRHPGDGGSPNRPIDRPISTETELSDSKTEIRPVSYWLDEIESRDPWRLACSPLDGLTIGEARWFFQGLDQADAEGVGTADLVAEELAATALYDMARKLPHRWSRPRFVAFMESAIRERTRVGDLYDDDAVAAVSRAWPL